MTTEAEEHKEGPLPHAITGEGPYQQLVEEVCWYLQRRRELDRAPKLRQDLASNHRNPCDDPASQVAGADAVLGTDGEAGEHTFGRVDLGPEADAALQHQAHARERNESSHLLFSLVAIRATEIAWEALDLEQPSPAA